MNKTSSDLKSKPPIQGATNQGKRERSFELPLPALVRGKGPGTKLFTEKTRLITISAEMATLRLKSDVKTGMKVDLDLEIPGSLILGNDLKLRVSGTVALAHPKNGPDGPGRFVAVRLDRKYRIKLGMITKS